MQKDLKLYLDNLDRYVNNYKDSLKTYLEKYEDNLKRLKALAENAKALTYPDSWEVIARDQSYFRVIVDGANVEFCITTFTVSITYSDNVHAIQYSNRTVKDFDDIGEMMQILINAFIEDLDKFKTLERVVLVNYHALWK